MEGLINGGAYFRNFTVSPYSGVDFDNILLGYPMTYLLEVYQLTVDLVSWTIQKRCLQKVKMWSNVRNLTRVKDLAMNYLSRHFENFG